MPKHRGRNSTGGARPTIRREAVNERPAPFEPDDRVAALLRAIWSRRAELTTSSRELVFSLLGQARTQPLTDKQLDAAATIGRQLGIGFDDPRLDDTPTSPATPVPPARAVQPWGPLPLRPPGR